MGVVNGFYIEGDSLSNDAYDASTSWPRLIQANRITSTAASGRSVISNMEPNYSANVAALSSVYDIAIIQGGVNDIIGSATAANLQTAVSTMISAAQSASMNVVVLNVFPFGNHTGWTSGKQTVLDDYNAWLATNESVLGFTLVDCYSLLEDGSNPDDLLAAYDSGDGLHLSAAGYVVVADAVDAALTSSGYLTNTDVANELAMWRGAVEPSETSPSGNEIQLWRGAVQPTAAAPSTGVAWKDYIPVSYVTGRTARWRTDDGEGFIPVVTK